jgi:glucosamine 6-phosphate synthetase-like amidotransferase/phosphosugar isomerase protein
LATTIHWDELIAGYNLQRKNTVDVDVPFLLSLSDKALPLLDTNIVVLQKKQNEVLSNNTPRNYCDTCFIEQLKQREKEFVEKQKQLSWLSWNYADAYTEKYFQRKGLITASHQ